MVGSDGALNTDPPMAAILLLLSPCRGQDIKAVGWAPGIGFTLSWLAYGGWKKSQSPVDGLSWFIPLFIGYQHVSTIQGGAGFLPSTVCWSSKSSLLRTIRVLGFCFLLVLTKHVPLPLFALFVWCLAAGVEIVQTKDKLRLTVSWNHG